MKLSSEPPEIYKKLHEVFGVEWEKGLIIANGDTIHTAVKFLPPQKIVHEETHQRQQTAYGIDKWWDRYLIDPEFRLSQELEAYRNEVKWIEKNILNRNLAYQLKHDIAKTLSSTVYGDIITFSKALTLIKNNEN